jgi:acetoin utilization deacetylase AcuC-like enzyme
LSESGVALRDRFVIETVRGGGIPLVIVLAGGYASTRERTAELHAIVFRAARDFESAVSDQESRAST